MHWKQKNFINQRLIEERENEIKFLEDEMLDFQQKRFSYQRWFNKPESIIS
jgi:hypothetical protein